MALQILQLTFNNELNESLQVGDDVYYTSQNTSPEHGFSISGLSNVKKIGTIVAMSSGNISTVNVMYDDSNITTPNDGDFIMFAKNKIVNTSNMLGYYAEAKFVNNDNEKHAELFAISSDLFESSK
jgi:preprotein translocase subunit YajC